MKAYDHDLAISAVSYDSLLVGELISRLRPRLEQSAVWAGQTPDAPETAFPVLGRGARAVLVLLHPLWSREPRTAADSGVLRQRMKRQPGSVVVLVLDDAVVPDWLETARRHDLAKDGLDPLVETLLTVISNHGGPLRELEPVTVGEAQPRYLHDSPQPFLEQARAQMALRRELESMSAELHARLVDDEADEDLFVEVVSLPNRFVGRHGDAAVSFSWVAGRGGAITAGRLLVIQWSGLAPGKKGMVALQTATREREVVYAAEGAGPTSWCWRADIRNGRACSSTDLVAEWLAGAGLRTPVVVAV